MKTPKRAILTPNWMQRWWGTLVPISLLIAGVIFVWGLSKGIKENRNVKER